MHSAQGCTQKDKYIPERRDAHNLTQDDDRLEYFSPTHTIGPAKTGERQAALQEVTDRAHDLLKEFRADPQFTDEVRENVEEQSSKI